MVSSVPASTAPDRLLAPAPRNRHLARLLIHLLALIFTATTIAQTSAPASVPASTAASAPSAAIVLNDLCSSDPAVHAAALAALPHLSPADFPLLNIALGANRLSRSDHLAIRRAMVAIRIRPIRRKALEPVLRDQTLRIRALRQAFHAAAPAHAPWAATVDSLFDALAAPSTQTEPQALTHIAELIHQAIAAGCNDPYIRFLALWMNRAQDLAPDQTLQVWSRYQSVAQDLQQSGYPSYVKLGCWFSAVQFLSRHPIILPSDAKARIDRMGQTCLALLPQALAQAPLDSNQRWVSVQSTYSLIAATAGRDAAYQKVSTIVQAACPQSFIAPLLKARYWGAAAVPPLGVGTEPARRLAAKRLLEVQDHVRAAATLAWERNHSCVLAADALMDLAGSPEEFDLWYHRAIAADPDDYTAHQRMVEHKLRAEDEPGPHLYAVTCGDHDRLDTGITLLLPYYHYRVGTRNGAPIPGYFTRPAVFAEISEVYQRYLAAFPDNLRQRCAFARVACWAQQWDIAAAQFDKLQDRFDPTIFRSRQQYESMRSTAFNNCSPALHPPRPSPR